MKIVYLMGKSASGKDTIYRSLRACKDFNFRTIVMYTTRPIRDSEMNGREYFFIDAARAREIEESGKLIEERIYNTVYGPWKYMTVDDGQFNSDGLYLTIGTIESYNRIKEYFGRKAVLPIYIEIDDGIRLERALARERRQKNPKYEEMCRRFLADQEDFSEEHLREAEIERRFDNGDIESSVRRISQYIAENISDKNQ